MAKKKKEYESAEDVFKSIVRNWKESIIQEKIDRMFSRDVAEWEISSTYDKT